jgi:hypothetical protein
MKMSIPIVTRLTILLLLSTVPNSFAAGWVLTAPDLAVTGTKVTPTKKWVVLESFTTALECKERRSSLISHLDADRRELRDADGHSAAIETEQELALLWYIYTKSKCVSSR